MDHTEDPCSSGLEALVIGGANGVCRASEHGLAPRTGALVLATLALALALHRARGARATLVIVGLAIACALPGFSAMIGARADRPTALASSARAVERLHGSMRRFALAHACAEVVVDRCLACEPIARLALAGLVCGRPAPIELHENALAIGCEERGDALVCGAP